MARRWIVAGGIVLACAGVGAAVGVITSDDSSDTATQTTTTVASTSLPTSTTRVPSVEAGPTTTSDAPSTGASSTGLPDPCGVETATIRTAIENAIDGARDRAQIDTCRLAAADPSWAAVHLVAKPGAEFASLAVLVHGGGGTWSVVASGGANVGCGQAPQQVLVDLGTVCSSEGGGL